MQLSIINLLVMRTHQISHVGEVVARALTDRVAYVTPSSRAGSCIHIGAIARQPASNAVCRHWQSELSSKEIDGDC